MTPPVPVVQSVARWLPPTETWLEAQVRHLPPWVVSHVACEVRVPRPGLPGATVTAAEDRPARRLADRALRRLGPPRPLGPVRPVARRSGARVLHSHFGHVGWFDHRAARSLGLRHVVSFYGFDVGQLPREDRRWIDRYGELFATAAAVLCEGPHMAGSLVALGCPPERVHVHRLGIDLSRLPDFRPRHYDDGRPLRVLLAGSFREKKGFPLAMDALGRLVADGLELEATLVGDADAAHGAERERILAAIRRNGLTERVRLLGFQPYERLLAEGATHDVFLSPSVVARDGDSEGGAPMAIVEMAAMGLPVLSTRHCDIPFVLGEPNRALLVPEHDAAALADATRRLLEADWTALAVANRRLVEEEYDCRRQGARLARVYVPEGPGRAPG